MRTYIFVTKVFGNIRIAAYNRDEATQEFLRRGYSHADIEEVR